MAKDTSLQSTEKKDVMLKVLNVSKSFKLPTEKPNGVKQAVINKLKGVSGYKKFSVLQDINFEVKKGDFLGIVGRNGSGKSTLLKIISGIYHPNEGSVDTVGKLVPFIELGVGFNPELTGRENVYMNGALLGFSPKEMDLMYDEIVEFAELNDFMEQKLKNYSSGMQVRLAFSIAIKAEADILVLDEVLAVGDESFQRKSSEYFSKLRSNDKTVILVTHDMGAVRKYCNKAILLNDGKVVLEGTPEDVANEYSLLNTHEVLHDDRIEKDGNNDGDLTVVKEEQNKLVKNLTAELISPKIIADGDTFKMQVQYEVTEDIPTRVGITVFDDTRQIPLMYDSDYKSDGKNTPSKKGKHSFEYTNSLQNINDSTISILISIFKVSDRSDIPDETIAFLAKKDSPTFLIRRKDLISDFDLRQKSALFRSSGAWEAK